MITFLTICCLIPFWMAALWLLLDTIEMIRRVDTPTDDL